METIDLGALLAHPVAGNTIGQWLSAGATFAVALAGAYLLRRAAIGRLRLLAGRTATDFDDFVVDLLGQIRHPEFFFVAFYLASRSLALNKSIDRTFGVLLAVALTYRAVQMLKAWADYALAKTLRIADDPAAASIHRNLRIVVNAVLWTAGAVFILDNLGIKVSAVVAGLGIGGVAVALAAQAILGDLFNSFVIYLDEPFKVGDFIIVGDLPGTVEHVGLKTTRVRSLHGELLIFPNTDLANSRIRNFKQLRERRVAFRFGVTYQTPSAKLREIPHIVRGIVGRLDQLRLDRVHFLRFGDSSLDFEVAYFVLSGDYNLYMDRQHSINLALFEAFAAAGIDFAHPTRTVFVEGTAAPARAGT